MYTTYYGLSAKPFALTPDPAFYFNGHQYASAQSVLDYAILQQEGVVVITGDAGCGKTTLLHHFLNKPHDTQPIGLINYPMVLKGMPLKGVLFAFNLPMTSAYEADLYVELQGFLQRQRRATLIVDEAQSLNRDTLEAIRMLTNPEPGSAAVLQLILVGQPALAQTLDRPEWRHFTQHVVTRYHLGPLDESTTVDYVRHRLNLAQCATRVFTPTAISRIHAGSAGIPRLINMICDISLMYGYAEGLRVINADIVNQVISDRGITCNPLHDLSGEMEHSHGQTQFLERGSTRLLFNKPQLVSEPQAGDPDTSSA